MLKDMVYDISVICNLLPFVPFLTDKVISRNLDHYVPHRKSFNNIIGNTLNNANGVQNMFAGPLP